MEEKEETRERLIQQAKRIEDECAKITELYTITSLEWSKGGFWQKNAVTLLTVLSAITTGSASSQIFVHTTLGVYFATAISLLVTILLPFLNLHKPEDRAAFHETARHKYAALEKQALLFHIFCASDINSNDELITKIMELQKQKDDLDASSVSLPSWVYKEKKMNSFKERYTLAFQKVRTTKAI